ncbi:PREDICTED: rho GTPase-activating protein REN1-like [Nicotiana attenuata]|uniref:Rho gtpase-activating protein ren1 n=1 Tax=Nicotiana attenuata TaxID=49451 RepID=A0A1J6J997_NICAT|nr:PREDICTED: rho GTPase-activating protein REN1-like [Nicotiana attenuata]OIT03785.1 rho gtpase-activating protein ren1 [Nicotiana attenuata]
MTNRNADANKVEGVNQTPPPPGANDQVRGGNKVYKSGPLFLSSRGIGWTSWKKRWFILTRTSLVFYRTDPNATPQKGSEVNLTLGGIDLNSSGSVVVKEDKKLLTVLFPDGRDGRAFTLKAETLEDLLEWKTALEEALANAPSAALVMGQNGIFRNDQANAVDVSLEQSNDRQPVKSMVIGRPVLLALEDIDGTPSFLEKALRFVEEHGVKVEGILRQAADVDDVEHRIREYEQGKTDFSPDEDAHIIADCVKYILRELPSSPVPASCCNALLEAFRTERGIRVNAMRTAILETFPEPNRRLLQRILMMMQSVVSHKTQNRMSTSAVAACMAPLLLRPLLAGDCELGNDFAMSGDSSVQLLQAAAAANHAQAIVITLLEEYGKLFGEGSVSPELYSDSDGSGTESGEEFTDDDYSYEEEEDDDDDAEESSHADVDDSDHDSCATTNEVGESEDSNKSSRVSKASLKTPEVDSVVKANGISPTSLPQTSVQHDVNEAGENVLPQSHENSRTQGNESGEQVGPGHVETSTSQKSTDILNGPLRSVRRPAVWGRTPAKKNLSMESIDIPFDDEDEIQRLEAIKSDLQTRVEEAVKGNALLHESLEKRKNALHEHRLTLEKDVARLQEQLQKETELRILLEAGIEGKLPISFSIDGTMKEELQEIAQEEADIINLKQRVDDLGLQLSKQREQNSRLRIDLGNQPQQSLNNHGKSKDKHKDMETNASKTLEKSARSKHETNLNKADSEKDNKYESPLSANKHPQSKQADSSQSTNSSVEAGMSRAASASCRKSSSRNEGANATTSALSKLTNRLNFLKERRTQLTASELQYLDKSQSGEPVKNNERGKGSEPHHPDKFQASQSTEKSTSDSHHALHHPDGQHPDRGTKHEIHPNLDKGKSESFPNTEKGRAIFPPRTNSR